MALTKVAAEHSGPSERITAARNREPAPQHQSHAPQPLDPAPDSRTVVDTDPWEHDHTSAGDTLNGATSQDVYGGLGRPMNGQNSREVRHDGMTKRKRALQGKDQYGTAEEVMQHDEVEIMGWKDHPRYQPGKRDSE